MHEPDIPFPTVRWGHTTATFHPGPLPADAPPSTAVVVFAWHDGAFVLADVPRGWCVPSGRIEPGETPLEAALRETREEIGADLEAVREIGYYALTDEAGVRVSVPTFVGTVRAFGQIPADSESRGARAVAPAGVAACYWTWDALMARMFAYAERELARDAPDGEAGEGGGATPLYR